MSNSSSPRPAAPTTVWSARGRHSGPAAADAVRRRLDRLKADGVLHSHLEEGGADPAPEHVFQARWLADGEVTVRARLALSPYAEDAGRQWVLVAEAERPWDPRWPSPAAMFWPQPPDAEWDREAVTGLRLGDANALPEDDKELRRVLRHAARDTWCVHVVVHEAMTPDERGRRAVVRLLPESLRHRVVEHRAAPHRLRAVNWVLDDFGARVPRGGAVVLPGGLAAAGHDTQDFAVRSVFLDGSDPAELLGVITRCAALPRPLPDGAATALTALREQWRLLTQEEELARARELVTMYSEALEAMTRSRDLYREAAERAHEALAVYREGGAEAAGLPSARKPGRPSAGSPLQQLARGFDRLRGTALSRRPGGAQAPGPRDALVAPPAGPAAAPLELSVSPEPFAPQAPSAAAERSTAARGDGSGRAATVGEAASDEGASDEDASAASDLPVRRTGESRD
ncbi:hypothetical protein [Streptomyces sp. NPDC046985]|uniref:hypothetical protein n=1 Tax=Streptomyces sp. NPDC046985 TaxID=3155377 RepID=UPI0034103A8E